MYHLFSSFLLLINFSLYSFCLSTPKSNFSSVLNIKIPGFNESGFLSWEIHADKISNKEKNLISAVKPSIYTYQNQKIQLTANTSSGLFDLKAGSAWGNHSMVVTGDGFSGQGMGWHWLEETSSGFNQIIFRNRAEITFWGGLNDSFTFDYDREGRECSPDDSTDEHAENIKNPVPTIASANYLEFLSVKEGVHRFLMDGNVSISGNNLHLTCEKVELLFIKDANETSAEIGRINKIEALGNVVLSQSGRKSYANEMTLDVPNGTAELRGSLKSGKLARVVDDEWGEASGERIILMKGKRMAKVVGNKGGRARLELPPIPDFGFDLDKDIKKTQNVR